MLTIELGEDIRRERQACNAAMEPDRCQLLEAFLGHGDVIETAFPDQVPSFFD